MLRDNILLTTNPNGSSYFYDLWKQYLKDGNEQYSIFKNEYLCDFPTTKENKKDRNEIPYTFPKTSIKWVTLNELCGLGGLNESNKNKNMEEQKEMNMTMGVKSNDFELGNVILKKNTLQDPFDSEVVLIVPGLTQDDFLVSVTDKGVAITLINECPDCGDFAGKPFYFDFNPYFEVDDVICTVENGILVLTVLYCLSNLEINECRDNDNEVGTTLRAVKPNNEQE
jgi:hypothetical protein